MNRPHLPHHHPHHPHHPHLPHHQRKGESRHSHRNSTWWIFLRIHKLRRQSGISYLNLIYHRLHIPNGISWSLFLLRFPQLVKQALHSTYLDPSPVAVYPHYLHRPSGISCHREKRFLIHPLHGHPRPSP